MKYEFASVYVGAGQFLWAQIPIVATTANTVNNLLEVVRMPNGACEYKIHSKMAYATQSLSPQYAFAADFFESTLDKFKNLEEQNGLKSVLDRKLEKIYFRL